MVAIVLVIVNVFVLVIVLAIVFVLVLVIVFDIVVLVVVIVVAERSLEVKLPTIWTDEKHSQEETRTWRKSEERRCRCAKR